MLEQCFVSTSKLNEYEKGLQAVLREQRLPIDGAEPTELTTETLSNFISTPDVDRCSRVVLVVGRVGAGKTTFIHRFFSHLERTENYARFILDLRTQARAAVDPGPAEVARLADFVLRQVSERYHAKPEFGTRPADPVS